MFLILENSSVCVVSFVKLNADVKTLCIQEKDNGIDRNHLTSENAHLTKQVAIRM